MKALLEQPAAAATRVAVEAPRALQRPRPRRRFGLVVRRVHLYSGLALVPFVLLYGITGGLLNHPTLLSSTLEVERVAGDELDGLGFAPRLGATELLAELARTPHMAGLVIAPHVEPRLRGRWVLRTSDGGAVHSLLVDANADDAKVFVRVGGVDEEPLVVAATDIPTNTALVARFESAATAALAAHDFPIANAELRDAPQLEFAVTRDGAPFTATYDLQTHALALEPRAAVTSGDRLRDFAIGLHFAHTYPTELGVRFFWALIVDAMAVSMAAWALTGLSMWWQMKTLRRIGAVVLGATAIATLPLVLSMWRELA